MTDMKLPPETAVAAYKAVATCTGTNKADVDTYKIMRFRIWEGIGALIEATDNMAVAQAWLPEKHGDSRPDTEADLEVNIVDSAGRVGGLIAHAARTEETLSLKLVEEEDGLPGFTKRVIDFRCGNRERLKAATLGVATPPLDGLFDRFEPAEAAAIHLGPSSGERLRSMTAAVGSVDLRHADNGTALVTPARYPGFDFRAIMSVAAPKVAEAAG